MEGKEKEDENERKEYWHAEVNQNIDGMDNGDRREGFFIIDEGKYDYAVSSANEMHSNSNNIPSNQTFSNASYVTNNPFYNTFGGSYSIQNNQAHYLPEQSQKVLDQNILGNQNTNITSSANNFSQQFQKENFLEQAVPRSFGTAQSSPPGEESVEKVKKRRKRRKEDLSTKYQYMFSLKDEKDKIMLDKICIDGKMWYSMWQLGEKLDEKASAGGKKKNRVRYVLQNRTKKERPENVLKLLTNPAKKVVPTGAHLFTPNKFTTFVEISEFREGASFAFLAPLLAEHEEAFEGKKYALSSKSVSGGLEIRLLQDDTRDIVSQDVQQLTLAPILPLQDFRERSSKKKRNTEEEEAEGVQVRHLPVADFNTGESGDIPLQSFRSFPSNFSTRDKVGEGFLQKQPSRSESPSFNAEEVGEVAIYDINLHISLFPSEQEEDLFSVGLETFHKANISKKIAPTQKQEMAVTIEGEKEGRQENSKLATLHRCTLYGQRVEFLTSIDLKRLLSEQLILEDKNAATFIARTMTDSICCESPSFERATYERHFDFAEKENQTAKIIVLRERLIGNKAELSRDEEGKRWRFKLINKYTHLEALPQFSVSDSQLVISEYEGPKEEVISLLEKMEGKKERKVYQESMEDQQVPLINSLIFNSSSFSLRDFCTPNKGHLMRIEGEGLNKSNFTCKVFSISASPISHKPENWDNQLYEVESSRGLVRFIRSDTLLQFLPGRNRNLLEFLCLGSPLFNFPFQQGGFQCFFLPELFCLPTHFELKRVSAQKKIWHLFVYDQFLHLSMDLTKFRTVNLASFPSPLKSFHFEISSLHHPHFRGHFSKYPMREGAVIPPSHAIPLLVGKGEESDRVISDIFVPPLKPGSYTLWVTFFKDFILCNSVSKCFIVRDI